MHKLWIMLCLMLLPTLVSHAGYTLKNGKWVNSNYVATMSVQEHYAAAMDAYQKQEWEELVLQALIVTSNFSSTPFADESLFYLGVGYFHTSEFEQANSALTQYLKKQATPKFFEEAIQYKFKIAEQFHGGAKRHILGWESMPKWLPARDEAIAIYDEVITALPHHELAAQALFGKGQLLLMDEDYKACVETYQTLIRRFPKHPLSVESYIGICEAYLVQCKEEYPDQDFLDLAEINLKKFRNGFPGEERLALAEGMVMEMKELFASNLYDTGRFYERTKKPHAAYIYYTRIMAKYPNTKTAQVASRRLTKMKYRPQEEKEESSEVVSPLLKLPVTGQLVDSEPKMMDLPSSEEDVVR